MKIAKVEWEDSFGLFGIWNSRESVEELRPSIITTVGFVVKEEKSHMTLTASVTQGESSDMQGPICIPRRAIKKVTVLRK